MLNAFSMSELSSRNNARSLRNIKRVDYGKMNNGEAPIQSGNESVKDETISNETP